MADKTDRKKKDRPERRRFFAALGDRKRVLGIAGGIVSFATTAAVAATVVVGHGPLMARASALKQAELKVAFDWPPLAGKSTSRTAGGEPATWMNAEQRHELERIAITLLSGNPFDRHALERTQKALKETGWFADGPWLKRFENGVVVISGKWRIPVAAVRTPAGDRLVTELGEPLPPIYPVGRSRLPIVSGVRAAEPPAGEKWPGGEVQAGLRLITFLRPMPGFEQVAAVDVSEFASAKRLSISTTTGGAILWGGPPDEFLPGQARAEIKRQRLAAVYQAFGQLDAGRAQIDVRSEDNVYTTDTTLAAADPEAANKPTEKAETKSKVAAKRRR
jgi:hypothetical protein